METMLTAVGRRVMVTCIGVRARRRTAVEIEGRVRGFGPAAVNGYFDYDMLPQPNPLWPSDDREAGRPCRKHVAKLFSCSAI